MKTALTILLISIYADVYGQIGLNKNISDEDRPDSLWYEGFPEQFIYGFQLYKKKDYENSEKIFRAFVENEKSDSLKAFGYYWLAMIQSQYDNPIKAIELIDQSNKLDETYYYVYHRGRFNYQNENLKQAIKDYTKAIKLDPDFSESYTWRGIARLYSGQLNKACQDFYEGAKRGSEQAYDLGTKYCQIKTKN